MIPQALRAVVLSFYSTGRQNFVPLLLSEITRRAKVHEHVAKEALADALQAGWLDSQTKDKMTTWHLTAKGEKAARTLMQAAEVARSS